MTENPKPARRAIGDFSSFIARPDAGMQQGKRTVCAPRHTGPRDKPLSPSMRNHGITSLPILAFLTRELTTPYVRIVIESVQHFEVAAIMVLRPRQFCKWRVSQLANVVQLS